MVGGGLVRASAGFGWVGLIQLFVVLPWLAPILWVAAHLYSRGPAGGDRTLRALLLGGTLALAGSSITVDYNDRRDCFLGACHGVDEPRPWWEAGRGAVYLTPITSIGLSVAVTAMAVIVFRRSLRLRRASRPA